MIQATGYIPSGDVMALKDEVAMATVNLPTEMEMVREVYHTVLCMEPSNTFDIGNPKTSIRLPGVMENRSFCHFLFQ